MASSQADEVSQERNMGEEAMEKQGRGGPGPPDGGGRALKESPKDLIMEKKEEMKMKISMTGECPREVLEATEEEGRKRLGDIRVAESAAKDNPEVEAAIRDSAAKEAAAHRGMAAKSNIIGVMGSLKEAIRSKLTMPGQIMSETQAAQRHAGTGRATGEEQVDVDSGNTSPGVVDSLKLKVDDVSNKAKEAITSNN